MHKSSKRLKSLIQYDHDVGPGFRNETLTTKSRQFNLYIQSKVWSKCH